jgi:hypothetical protein
LSEGENFQGSIASTANEDSEGDRERVDDFEHELIVLTRRNVVPLGRRCESQVADYKPAWTFVYERGSRLPVLLRRPEGRRTAQPPTRDGARAHDRRIIDLGFHHILEVGQPGP